MCDFTEDGVEEHEQRRRGLCPEHVVDTTFGFIRRFTARAMGVSIEEVDIKLGSRARGRGVGWEGFGQ